MVKINKKGNLDIILIFLIIIILIVSVTMLTVFLSNMEKEKACKNIGFEDYKYIDSFQFCEDLNGNLNYVQMKCPEFLIWKECTAKEISVGEMGVIEQ